jgi:hypothetical protein
MSILKCASITALFFTMTFAWAGEESAVEQTEIE